MYQCIRCNQLHEEDSTAEKIFTSGYVILGEEKIPLGICCQEQIQKSFVSRGFKSFIPAIIN
jgi:hypothetical protein